MAKEITVKDRADANRAVAAAMDWSYEILHLAWADEEKEPGRIPESRAIVEQAVQSGEVSRTLAILLEKPDNLGLATVVAELVACWPPREKAELEIFSRYLAADVMRTNPTRAALLMACRHLRTTLTFPPSIAEVLAAVEEANRSCLRVTGQLAILAERPSIPAARAVK